MGRRRGGGGGGPVGGVRGAGPRAEMVVAGSRKIGTIGGMKMAPGEVSGATIPVVGGGTSGIAGGGDRHCQRSTPLPEAPSPREGFCLQHGFARNCGKAITATSSRHMRAVGQHRLPFRESHPFFRPEDSLANSIGNKNCSRFAQSHDACFLQLEIGIVFGDNAVVRYCASQLRRVFRSARNHGVGIESAPIALQ